MKSSIVLTLVFAAGVLYARVSPAVGRMLPQERRMLALSMQASADAYDGAGSAKKAAQYRSAALDVYPLGDEGHRLARRLGVTLDDEATYQAFMEQADIAYNAKNYNEAIAAYLMALELRQPLSTYEKLQMAYDKGGNKAMAEGLQQVITEFKRVPREAPAQEAYPKEEYQEEYQAEAVEAPPLDEAYEEAYEEAYQEEAYEGAYAEPEEAQNPDYIEIIED